MACDNNLKKEDLVFPLRVFEDFVPVGPFIKTNRVLPCRMKCAICSRPWGKTGVTHVHLLFHQKNTYYVCGDCKNIKKK